MTRFLLIRHATNEAVGKKLAGRMTDLPLNEEGLQQAESLAYSLKNIPVTAIYSSPLERAMQTAIPLARLRGLEVTPCNYFQEIDYGDWTGAAFNDLENQGAFKRYNNFRSFTRVPGGELMAEAQLRIIKGIENLCHQHPQGTLAVFSHSDVIKSAIAYFAGIHTDMFQRLEIYPASVSILVIYPETARIVLLNHTGPIHL